ncbi:MAG: fumarylacetoacetate hydrolase family protein [Betaproteobacteria bacterium]|nr:fumarylacetoacetate hydrolase family protein [Betaproteobacteria bacterium]
MKLLRYGPAGREKPGLLDAEGRIRDLSGVVRDIDASAFSPQGQKKLARIKPASLPLVKGTPRLGVPFVGISKFIGIGLNYRDHAEEAGMPIPSEPIVFNKWTTCISGPNDDVVQPPHSTKLDWEVELGVVIGSPARYVSQSDALHHVAGYCVVNDISERQFQLERGSQWDKGKGCDSFGPIGPWLVTPDDVPDPQALDLWLDVNGQKAQRGNTRHMIFGVAHIVSYLSQFMTLLPGDVICTGTPPGVGMGMKPTPRYLQPGDVMTLGIAGLGEQRQRVAKAG